MMSDDTILLGAESGNRTLRREVEIVRPQPDYLASYFIERVAEKKQLARGVDVTALPASGVKSVADLDSCNAGNDVVVARRSYNCSRGELPHSPREHIPGVLPF